MDNLDHKYHDDIEYINVYQIKSKIYSLEIDDTQSIKNDFNQLIKFYFMDIIPWYNSTGKDF